MICKNCGKELIYGTDGESDWYYCDCTPYTSYDIQDIAKRCEEAENTILMLKILIENIKLFENMEHDENFDKKINTFTEAKILYLKETRQKLDIKPGDILK